MKKKVIAVDLDETLCTGSKGHEEELIDGYAIGKYKYCTPIQSTIDKVNQLYDEGHKIVIYTSRGMGTLGGDLGLIYSKLYDSVRQDLDRWGVKYTQLVFGKIYFDVLIDDKVCNVRDFIEKGL